MLLGHLDSVSLGSTEGAHVDAYLQPPKARFLHFGSSSQSFWSTRGGPRDHQSKAAASPTELLSGVALTTEGAPHGACLNA